MLKSEIRQKAKRALGKWMAKMMKGEISAAYTFFRSLGFRAEDALKLSKELVQENFNKFAESNFFSGPSR